jgi:transmembrane sensor
MNDLAEELARARSSIDVRWSEERAERIARGARTRLRIRRGAGVAVGALVVLVAVAGGARLWRAQSPAPDGLTVRFSDGSTASRREPTAVVLERSSAPRLEVVELARGAATFEVVANPARVFRVEVGPVVVEVLGTRFTVERFESAVTVAVERGRVRVTGPQGDSELVGGERGEFSFAPSRTLAAPEVEAPAAPSSLRPRAAAPHALMPASSGTSRSWKALAEDGDYDGAYALLHGSPGITVRDEAAELFLEADVARLSHHPADAIAPLRRLVERHPSDARAPLAAFTLGSVLLELGSPREAGDAFVEAQRLDPDGPMAEDAQAREVEALSRAGEVQRARARAEAYVKAYPNGRRIRAVRRFGNLE